MAKAIEMLALWLSDLPAMQTVSEMRPQSPISKLLTRFELSNQAGFCIISRIIQLLRKFMEPIDSVNRFASSTWNWGLSENMAPPNPMEHLLAHHFPNMFFFLPFHWAIPSVPTCHLWNHDASRSASSRFRIWAKSSRSFSSWERAAAACQHRWKI